MAAENAVGEYREALEQDGELVLDGALIVSRYRCELAGVAAYEKG